MRQLLINELQPADVQKIDAYLSSNTQQSEMPGLFWITLPENILTEDQKNHDKCGPFLFSIELGEDFVSFELLVRGKANLHCSCTCYATKEQIDFVLAFAEQMLNHEKIMA